MVMGRPGKVQWTPEQIQTIRSLYKTLGPKALAAHMSISVDVLTNKAHYLGIKSAEPTPWTDDMIATLTARYTNEGPTKLAREFGLTKLAVLAKARRLGLKPTRKCPPSDFQWTEDKLSILKERYVEEGGQVLAKEFNLSVDTVRRKASSLGLHTIAGHAVAGRIRAENSTSCNIHYFDVISPSSAYVLGFIAADGCVQSSMNTISIVLSIKDEKILQFIKKELKYTGKIGYGKSKRTKAEGHKIVGGPHCYLSIGSTVLAQRLVQLGIKPRKTYNDDPFPTIPDAMLPHFVRGFLDGDGTVSLYKHRKRWDACLVGFIGSVRFITGLRDALVRLAGMSPKQINIKKGKLTDVAIVAWSGLTDLRCFWDFVYADYLAMFCLHRKRDRLDQFLSERLKQRDTVYRKFTEEEERLICDLYHKIGPTKLAEKLGRDRTTVQAKVKLLGLRPIVNNAPWTDEEIQKLREMYATNGPTQIGKLLNRSWWTVRHLAISLGLKCDKTTSSPDDMKQTPVP